MKSLLTRLQEVRDRGVLCMAEILCTRWVPPWVFRLSSGNIYDLDVEKLCTQCQLIPDDIVFRCIDDSDSDAWRELKAFTGNAVPAETTVNDLGYAIYDASAPNRLLAGVWVAKEDFQEEELGFRVKLKPHQGWLYCVYVSKQSRGRGIYKTLLSLVAKHSRERGVTQLVCVVHTWNRISRLAHEQRSRWIIGKISSLRVGFLVWLSTAGNTTLDRRFVPGPSKNPAWLHIQEECWKRISETGSNKHSIGEQAN